MPLLSWVFIVGFAAFYRHKPASIRTEQGGNEVHVKVITIRETVRGVGGGAGTNC